MSQRLTVFRQKKIGSFIKTAFYVLPSKVSRRNCCLKKNNIFFSDFRPEIFWLWMKDLCNCVGYAFYVSGQRFEEIGQFENSFTIVVLRAKRSQPSSTKFPGGLLELHYTCPKYHFEKKWIFWWNNLTCWRDNFNSVLLMKKIRILWRKFAGSSELKSTHPRVRYEVNNFFWAVKTLWLVM